MNGWFTDRILYDPTQFPVCLGTYRTGTANALRNADLLPLARMRRKQISQLMVPVYRDGAAKRLPKGKYLVSRKAPLEREIRVPSSLEQIEADWQQAQRKQSVKGWVVR